MGVCIGDLMAVAEVQEWQARDAAWWGRLTQKRRGEMAEARFCTRRQEWDLAFRSRGAIATLTT
jgi:hypothetical protein